MGKKFNVTGVCRPDMHYMVNLESRLEKIRTLVDEGEYFSINRARQYGKTTILRALAQFLQADYTVVSLDFQMLSHASFADEASFVRAFAGEVLMAVPNDGMPQSIVLRLQQLASSPKESPNLRSLFLCLSDWCAGSRKPVVMMIDEVDSAPNNQVFLDFLAQLRGYYLHRDVRKTFQSVILAGVYDIRNIKRKFRQDEEYRINSPWNIAAEFDMNMDFTQEDIEGMLVLYETDYRTGMDISEMALMLYDYTSGYPFLVSRLCKLMDEKVAGTGGVPDKSSAWTRAGFLEAVKLLLSESNALFDDMRKKLFDYPHMRDMLYGLLYEGRSFPYNTDDAALDTAKMFGYIKECDAKVMVANRIFETRLYNLFLAEETLNSRIYKAADFEKNRFVQDGRLNMELVLKRFAEAFADIYSDAEESFLEENGRRFFLLYLKPIINGVGNYYVEARTRDMRRTDVIIDYRGEQFVCELKIWHGEEYNKRGEQQLIGYLDDYHLTTGYMLSFNFNKNKKVGVDRIFLDGRVIVEAVV